MSRPRRQGWDGPQSTHTITVNLGFARAGETLRNLVAPDPNHAYRRKVRGTGCVQCGEVKAAPVHKHLARKSGAVDTNSPMLVCLDCKGPKSRSAIRCKSCSDDRKEAAAKTAQAHWAANRAAKAMRS